HRGGGPGGREEGWGKVLRPPIDECLGLTTAVSPANPSAHRLRRIAAPSDDARGLPPTSATQRGANTRSRPKVDIASLRRKSLSVAAHSAPWPASRRRGR